MKVTGTKGTQGVSKSKKSSKSSKTSGVSFDALVEAASGVENVEATVAAEGVDSIGAISGDESNSNVPNDAEGRGNYILEQLEELEKDILNGNETGAVSRLKEALAFNPADIDDIDSELKAILDEIEARAQIEVAKLES